MSSSHRPRERALNGRHVLLGLIGFFALVFVVNGIMVYKAESTFGGLDTADAYRKGLAYNERIAAAAEQEKRGWRDRLEYIPTTRRMRVALTDKDGGAITGLSVSARMQRPATNRFDQEIFLEQTGPDAYEADVSGLTPGWWTVDIKAGRGEETALYESRRRLWIKP